MSTSQNVIIKSEANIKIILPDNPNDPLIVEPIDLDQCFELDLEASDIKQYAINGKLNFIIKGLSGEEV